MAFLKNSYKMEKKYTITHGKKCKPIFLINAWTRWIHERTSTEHKLFKTIGLSTKMCYHCIFSWYLYMTWSSDVFCGSLVWFSLLCIHFWSSDKELCPNEIPKLTFMLDILYCLRCWHALDITISAEWTVSA